MCPSLPQAPNASFYDPGNYQPDQSVGYLMRLVLTSIRSQADAKLVAHDLTYVQWLPLFKLTLNDGNTPASLSRDLEIDPAAMTRSLDRLEAKGLVRRERSTGDRRVVQLVLTDEGRHVALKVPAVITEVLNAHLTGFSEAEWVLLRQFLERMLVNGGSFRQACGKREAGA